MILLSVVVFAQNTQKDLEEKRKKLESEIEFTNKLLNETRSNKQSTLNQLNLLEVKVSKRTDLVATLKSELFILNSKIGTNERQLKKLEENLDEIKSKYAKVAWYAYKYRSSYSKLVFLFSSDDINQAYQRMRYLDQLASYLRNEAENIRSAEEEKNNVIVSLKAEKSKKNELLINEQKEIFELEKEQLEISKIQQDLQSREQQLRKSLREKQKQTAELDRQIKIIIAEATKATTDNKGNTVYETTPEEKELTSSFLSNRGKLPWPTERGVIASTFGVHNHPVLKKVKIKNNGIDIATSSDSEARAVFKGKVVSITKISNTNLAIIIRHGDYFTVYSNIEYAYVKKGDDVDTKEVIGRIHTNLKGKTELHFEVWKGSQIQNPSYWITSQ